MNTSHASHEDDMDSLPLDSANTPLPFREKIMFESIYPKTVKPRVEKTEKASIKEIKEKDIMIEKIDKMDKVDKIDKKIIETFVQEIPKERTKLWRGFKDVVIATFLFCLFQFPFIDNLINKMFKTESVNYRLFIKCVAFALFFFLLSNISLSSR